MSAYTHVKSARVRTHPKTKAVIAPYSCFTCRQPIEPGTPYTWYKKSRFTPRFNWHQGCAAPAPSVLETNEKRATIMAGCEAAYALLESLELTIENYEDDLKSITDELAQAFTEAAEMYRESAEAIEEGFQHATYQSDELNEYADQCESAAQELEQWDADEVDAEEIMLRALDLLEDTVDNRASVKDVFDDLLAEAIEEQRESCQSAVDEAESQTP